MCFKILYLQGFTAAVELDKLCAYERFVLDQRKPWQLDVLYNHHNESHVS